MGKLRGKNILGGSLEEWKQDRSHAQNFFSPSAGFGEFLLQNPCLTFFCGISYITHFSSGSRKSLKFCSGPTRNFVLNEIILKNKPQNTHRTETWIWNQFSAFREARKYEINREKSKDTLANMLKDWAYNMRNYILTL